MALPKAAQKQVEAAEKLHAETYAEETPDAEAQAANQEEVAKDSEATLSEVPQDQGGDQAPIESPDAPKADSVDHWKHKYDVLQGKYDAEVPRLQQSNNALTGRLSEMETQMASLSEKMSQPAEPITPSSHLTSEEIEDYGDDMIAVVKKAAREEFEPMLKTLQEENGQLRGLLGGMQQQTVHAARDEMMSTLDGELSNWRELNQQPDFLGWLENVDPYSGGKKLDMLRQAFENNNTSRVLAFFKGFLNENAAYTPTSAPNAPASPQVGLDTLVAPGRATEGGDSRAQEGNATGRTWSQKDISDFYRDVNRGVYRNDPDERARLENDIFLAQSQGRISP